MNKPIVWSIAGADNSGGAGIQADNLTLHDFNVHGCNIITAITAQNSECVKLVNVLPVDVFTAQYQTLIKEYSPNAIKLGMLGNVTIVEALVECLIRFDVPVICDPVCRSSSGGNLCDDITLYQRLFPFISVLTPNQKEFLLLAQVHCSNSDELVLQATAFAKRHKLDMVVTGGESIFSEDFSADLCIINGNAFWLQSPKQHTNNTHGTGCTFSSAIAALLAQSYPILDAVILAKSYINQCLSISANFKAKKGAIQHGGFPHAINTLPLIILEAKKVHEFPRESSLQLGIYPVVNSVEWLEKCLEEGIETIQLRIKNCTDDALDAVIQQACALGKKYQARLYINDYWQLAIKHNAYGVHLGQEDIDTADINAIAKAGLHLGISTHSWYELARAHTLQPSYIAIGPIYETTTKVMPFAPQGLQQLKQWVDFIGDAYPIVAIGGINLINAEQVLATGVGAIAMVRAITEAQDYKAAIKQLQSAMEVVVANV